MSPGRSDRGRRRSSLSTTGVAEGASSRRRTPSASASASSSRFLHLERPDADGRQRRELRGRRARRPHGHLAPARYPCRANAAVKRCEHASTSSGRERQLDGSCFALPPSSSTHARAPPSASESAPANSKMHCLRSPTHVERSRERVQTNEQGELHGARVLKLVDDEQAHAARAARRDVRLVEERERAIDHVHEVDDAPPLLPRVVGDEPLLSRPRRRRG